MICLLACIWIGEVRGSLMALDLQERCVVLGLCVFFVIGGFFGL